MFIAALFIVSETWKQSRLSSIEEREKKSTMEYYSAIKSKTSLLFGGWYMELENIILSEVTQF